MSIDRHDLQSFFPAGIVNFISPVSVVAHKRRDFDKPDYPYITFDFRYAGLAPWENRDTGEGRETVPSSSNTWQHDVEVDRSKQHILTVSQDVKAGTDGRASFIAQELDSYWRNQFDREAWDNGYKDLYFHQIDTVDTTFEVPGDTQIDEKRQTVDAQIVTLVEFVRQIATIEHVEFDSNNQFLEGEKLP